MWYLLRWQKALEALGVGVSSKLVADLCSRKRFKAAGAMKGDAITGKGWQALPFLMVTPVSQVLSLAFDVLLSQNYLLCLGVCSSSVQSERKNEEQQPLSSADGSLNQVLQFICLCDFSFLSQWSKGQPCRRVGGQKNILSSQGVWAVQLLLKSAYWKCWRCQPRSVKGRKRRRRRRKLETGDWSRHTHGGHHRANKKKKTRTHCWKTLD